STPALTTLLSFPTRRSSDLPDRRRDHQLQHPDGEHRARGELRHREAAAPDAGGRGLAAAPRRGAWVVAQARGGWWAPGRAGRLEDRKSTRLNSSHVKSSYAV